MRERKDISSQVLLVVDHRETDKSTTEIRVIEWSINGKKYINLEKRDLFRDDSGEEKMGKAKGFNRKDLELIYTPGMREKILRAFGVKVTTPETVASAAASQPEAEVAQANLDF